MVAPQKARKSWCGRQSPGQSSLFYPILQMGRTEALRADAQHCSAVLPSVSCPCVLEQSASLCEMGMKIFPASWGSEEKASGCRRALSPPNCLYGAVLNSDYYSFICSFRHATPVVVSSRPGCWGY